MPRMRSEERASSKSPLAPSPVGFVGYGRFGAALGGLMREAGHAVRAYDPDPAASLGEAARAGSVAEAVAGARYVVLAVPVGRMGEAVSAVAPHLQEGQIVLDVGSVKLHPEADLGRVLGARRAWVATHPMFGPMSLLRGERPLRVVVCPNRVHPEAVREVIDLYRGLGCQVIEEDAETHDRVMAWTHALTFFVAKGMLDAGVPLDVPYAPPSFQAIARTIESVRADAGHLFTALHRENPVAGEARRRLLQTLAAADAGLSAMEAAGPGGSAAGPGADAAGPGAETVLDIPDLGIHSPVLREAREMIDEIDQEIIQLLARRATVARRAGAAKAALGRAVFDPAREAQLLGSRREWAEQEGLEGDAVLDIFRSIMLFSRGVQGRTGT